MTDQFKNPVGKLSLFGKRLYKYEHLLNLHVGRVGIILFSMLDVWNAIRSLSSRVTYDSLGMWGFILFLFIHLLDSQSKEDDFPR